MQQDADGEVEPESEDGGALAQTVFPPRRPKTYELKKGQVGVRFINTSGDPDVCTAAYPGEIVTKVAKRCGVKIATACNSGICGTCMTDLEDANGKSYRPGFQVVRACVTPGLDIYPNRAKSGKLNNRLAGSKGKRKGEKMEAETVVDAMKRFEEGWEDEYQPDGSNDDKNTPAFVSKNFAGTLVDPITVRTPISYNAQKRMENKYMYDALPENVRRSNPPGGGRDLEEKMDAARQIDIRQRMQKERRERVNHYLDLAHRPIASTADIMALSQEEVDSRSRFFNEVPSTWEQAYGPPNLPEVERERSETGGRKSEGVTEARMSLYRSARQIPRYRFFGDPPLKEQDEAYFAEREDPMRRIKFEDAAELDRLAVVSGENSQDKNLFVYRDSRTGRVAPPHKAGSPGTVRAEMREKQLPVCGSCEGTGLQDCQVCHGTGINAAATGLHDLVCPR
ncbi:expressed unknown protein [Ectocarpus siliculosus]|uniref:2Fe-2S ferredoxin-type domain-containing protein n=1 Tax=Ectocarpus siliculosus TaxID=2880 RepID=D8LM70_ECTSI|nr:expressed unknown protein [Ectocarpus siliculosus]|eukprot:CBN79703.1 expressed unknown protein [Ectocarpus siliculosus]